MANTTCRSLCENTYGCGYIGDLSYFTFVSVVVIVIIDRGFLIGVVGGHRRRVCHACTTRNLGLGGVFFSDVFKFVAISGIL